MYQDDDFGLRFVGALETLLDPIVATLDALPAYFDPDLAPRDVLELLAAWLGISVDESWPDERAREALRVAAAELGRRRGTMQGLELALRIAFPDLPLRVEDGGKVTWSTDPDATRRSRRAELRRLLRHADRRARAGGVARVIERAKPVHVPLPAPGPGVEEGDERGGAMRVCPKCAHENADDADFCEKCRTYLRWEPDAASFAFRSPRPTPRPRRSKPTRPATASGADAEHVRSHHAPRRPSPSCPCSQPTYLAAARGDGDRRCAEGRVRRRSS